MTSNEVGTSLGVQGEYDTKHKVNDLDLRNSIRKQDAILIALDTVSEEIINLLTSEVVGLDLDKLTADCRGRELSAIDLLSELRRLKGDNTHILERVPFLKALTKMMSDAHGEVSSSQKERLVPEVEVVREYIMSQIVEKIEPLLEVVSPAVPVHCQNIRSSIKDSVPPRTVPSASTMRMIQDVVKEAEHQIDIVEDALIIANNLDALPSEYTISVKICLDSKCSLGGDGESVEGNGVEFQISEGKFFGDVDCIKSLNDRGSDSKTELLCSIEVSSPEGKGNTVYGANLVTESLLENVSQFIDTLSEQEKDENFELQDVEKDIEFNDESVVDDRSGDKELLSNEERSLGMEESDELGSETSQSPIEPSRGGAISHVDALEQSRQSSNDEPSKSGGVSL